MTDTNFEEPALPPKWRSSMTVYYYVVPKEQTADTYPDSRIVYLRLSCSITGWNLDEEIKSLEDEVDIEDLPDDVQESIFEAFQAGKLSEYSPCTNAIAQIAIYPHHSDDVGPDDFPFVLDAEPKKRELYETRSESGEHLSGSSENLKVQTGSTTTDSTELTDIESGSGGFSLGAGPAAVNMGIKSQHSKRKNTDIEAVDLQTTDTSREKRETTSFTTTFNQMYQLFNAYHLGTNRGTFYMQPRPHSVTPETEDIEDYSQVEHNLVNGERKLEGLQDMFLVVQVPEALNGICVQANLDTSHTINIYEQGLGTKLERRQFLVTRRIIRNCAEFNEAGDLIPSGVPAPPPESSPFPDTLVVVAEEALLPPAYHVPEEESGPGIDEKPNETGEGLHLSSTFPVSNVTGSDRVKVANYMNLVQDQVRRKMLRGFTGDRYASRPVEETQTFELLLRSVVAGSNLDIERLVELDYIREEDQQLLKRVGVESVSELFTAEVEERIGEGNRNQLEEIRDRISQTAFAATKDVLSSARAVRDGRDNNDDGDQ